MISTLYDEYSVTQVSAKVVLYSPFMIKSRVRVSGKSFDGGEILVVGWM